MTTASKIEPLGRFLFTSLLLGGCTISSPGQEKYRPIPHTYSIEDPQFQRSIDGLLGERMSSGNKVETLLNGDQTFPAMLQEIGKAKESINFETYIYWDGKIGTMFAEALAERAEHKVEVRIIVDWIGANRMKSAELKMMQDAGVQILQYHPLHWYNLSRINYRTHRKLLILDGKIAFTGGIGIADQWLGNAQDNSHWRDNHYRIEGPVVAEIQGTFAEHWLKSEGEGLDNTIFFPRLTAKGDLNAQMLKSSPYEGVWTTELMYRLAITASAKSINIETPYFVPDDLITFALIEAAKRGVKIRIIVPGSNIDMLLLREASRDGWEPFLEHGIEFYEYQPTMFHCKLMIADDVWVSVGSTNFDNRSFHLNDEANLNIFDRDFAAEQKGIFDRDLGDSKRVHLAEWKRQPWYRRILARIVSQFNSQL